MFRRASNKSRPASVNNMVGEKILEIRKHYKIGQFVCKEVLFHFVNTNFILFIISFVYDLFTMENYVHFDNIFCKVAEHLCHK